MDARLQARLSTATHADRHTPSATIHLPSVSTDGRLDSLAGKEAFMALSIGCLHVRRSVFINATPSRVWQEFVDFEHLNRWLVARTPLRALSRKLVPRLD